MKRLSTIIMALALVLGMSQCKKQETPTNGDSGEKVYVTLNVSNGESLAVNVNDNGGRHAVAPNLGVIQFRNGDVLYVGYHGKYIGQLTYNNGAFGGTLNAPIDGVHESLHFYFLGGKAPATAPTAGTTDNFTINIADQSTNLPVLCYGASSQEYVEGGSYTASLAYKCALVKFNLNKETKYDCILSNMPTEATISFATTSNNFTPIAKTNTTGAINLYREEGNTGVRWAILLPGTDLSADGNVEGEPEEALVANQFINSGITLKNPVCAAPNPTFAVKTSAGVLTQFSVSPTQKVYFSKGNLKADFSNRGYAHGWSFHDTQFGEVAGPTGSTDPQNKLYYVHQQSGSNNNNPGAPNGIIFTSHQDYGDRFTWGYFSEINQTEKEYLNVNEDLSKTAVVAKDWGCVFAENSPEGGNWRTLSADEWIYLFNGATTGTSNTVRGDKRFLRVRIKNFYVNPIDNRYNEECWGVFVFPDNYQGSNFNGTYTFNSNTLNQIDYSDANSKADVTKMLDDGAVFLPCVGYRYDDRYYDYVYYRYETIGSGIGYYWSSTCTDSNPYKAKALKFVVVGGGTNSTTGVSIENLERQYGYCVRLVWDAN